MTLIGTGHVEHFVVSLASFMLLGSMRRMHPKQKFTRSMRFNCIHFIRKQRMCDMFSLDTQRKRQRNRVWEWKRDCILCHIIEGFDWTEVFDQKLKRHVFHDEIFIYVEWNPDETKNKLEENQRHLIKNQDTKTTKAKLWGSNVWTVKAKRNAADIVKWFQNCCVVSYSLALSACVYVCVFFFKLLVFICNLRCCQTHINLALNRLNCRSFNDTFFAHQFGLNWLWSNAISNVCFQYEWILGISKC